MYKLMHKFQGFARATLSSMAMFIGVMLVGCTVIVPDYPADLNQYCADPDNMTKSLPSWVENPYYQDASKNISYDGLYAVGKSSMTFNSSQGLSGSFSDAKRKFTADISDIVSQSSDDTVNKVDIPRLYELYSGSRKSMIINFLTSIVISKLKRQTSFYSCQESVMYVRVVASFRDISNELRYMLRKHDGMIGLYLSDNEINRLIYTFTDSLRYYGLEKAGIDPTPPQPFPGPTPPPSPSPTPPPFPDPTPPTPPQPFPGPTPPPFPDPTPPPFPDPTPPFPPAGSVASSEGLQSKKGK